MSRVCDICGKGPSVGNVVVRKGSPTYKGGIGLHPTGIPKRRFLPNLQPVRTTVDGQNVRVRVCAKCLKAGKVQRVSAV